MGNLESKLFSEDQSWLSGTYRTTGEAFTVAEYFAKYVRRRWPQGKSDLSGSERGHLYLEYIDVDFRPVEEVPRKLVRLGFSSDTLQVLLPDTGYSDSEKEKLRDFYQQKYAPILKESHARTNALLWQTFSGEERNEILSMFGEHSKVEREIKKAIRRDLGQAREAHESEAIHMQTRNPSRPADDEDRKK